VPPGGINTGIPSTASTSAFLITSQADRVPPVVRVPADLDVVGFVVAVDVGVGVAFTLLVVLMACAVGATGCRAVVGTKVTGSVGTSGITVVVTGGAMVVVAATVAPGVLVGVLIPPPLQAASTTLAKSAGNAQNVYCRAERSMPRPGTRSILIMKRIMLTPPEIAR
jgi:hypothetical protein